MLQQAQKAALFNANPQPGRIFLFETDQVTKKVKGDIAFTLSVCYFLASQLTLNLVMLNSTSIQAN